jgi:rsbT co-antagonist protein RsbR
MRETGDLMQGSETPETSVAELRAQIARLEAENAALRTTRTLLQGIADNAPVVIYIKDKQGRFVLSNALHAELLGLTSAEVIGKQDADFLPPAVATKIDRVMAAMFESGVPQTSVFEIELSGEPRVFQELMFPIRDEHGEILALGGIASDITESHRAEDEKRNAALQAEIIEAQGRVIRELSAPVLPLADGVVVMPLVGSMSRERIEQIARSLLERVHVDSIHMVLLDVTGMPDFDDAAVDEFLRLLRAIRLLGARTLLTGIGAALARRFLTRTEIIREVETVSTVQAGVELALQTARSRG